MRLLLLGDSLTANPGAYPERLRPRLGPCRFIGRYGIRPIRHDAKAGTTWEWLATLGSGSHVRWFCQTYGTPSVIVVLYGTNDLGLKTMAELPAAFASMWSYCDQALAAWRKVGARILVCHLPGPCDDDAAYAARGQDRATWEYAVAQANAGYDERAETIALPTLPGDWPVNDCFHLAAAGYERIATNIAARIEELKRRIPVGRRMRLRPCAGVLRFDGVNSRVTGQQLGWTGAQPHTFASWVRWRGGTNVVALGVGEKVLMKHPYIGVIGSKFTQGNYGGAGYQRPAGRGWHLLIGTYDGANVVLTVDDAPTYFYPCVMTINFNTSVPTIGNLNGGGYPWGGEIGPSQIWDRVLTDDEKLDLFYDGTIPADGLRRNWPLESIVGGKTPELVGGTMDTVTGAVVDIHNLPPFALRTQLAVPRSALSTPRSAVL